MKKPMHLSKMFDLVTIHWDDASALDHGWIDPTEQKLTQKIVRTTGYVGSITEEHIALHHTNDSDVFLNGAFQVPRVNIKKIRLREPGPITQKERANARQQKAAKESTQAA
jgi:hypothetical protein